MAGEEGWPLMIPIVDQGAKIRNAVFWAAGEGCIIAGDHEADEQNLAQSLIFVVADGRKPMFRFLEWIAHAACLLPDERGALISSDEGRLLTVSGGSIDEGRITFSDGFAGRIVIRSLLKIDKQVFGVGMSGLIVRRRADALWDVVEMPRPTRPGIEAIDGFTATELYAVGWNGALLWLDGATTVDNASPTSVILTSICCAEDGFAYACGQEGVILRGRQARWDIICKNATDENLWDIASFRGVVYVSTILSLYIIHEDSLVPVVFGDDPPTSCYKIFVHDQFLWSIGREDILRFDGSNWERLA